MKPSKNLKLDELFADQYIKQMDLIIRQGSTTLDEARAQVKMLKESRAEKKKRTELKPFPKN